MDQVVTAAFHKAWTKSHLPRTRSASVVLVAAYGLTALPFAVSVLGVEVPLGGDTPNGFACIAVDADVDGRCFAIPALRKAWRPARDDMVTNQQMPRRQSHVVANDC